MKRQLHSDVPNEGNEFYRETKEQSKGVTENPVGDNASTKRPNTFSQTVSSPTSNLLQSGGGSYIIAT